MRRYEFYVRQVKTIVYERSAVIKYNIRLAPREDKIRILKQPCNVLFIRLGKRYLKTQASNIEFSIIIDLQTWPYFNIQLN